MVVVKFVHSVRYNRQNYPAHTPFEVDDNDIALLQKQGAIILSSIGEEIVNGPVMVSISDSTNEVNESNDEVISEDNSKLRQELMEYTVNELIDYAKENNIDLKGKTRKADIYNIIVSTL